MKDRDKTKEQLMQELAELRQRVAQLEAAESENRHVEAALKEIEERYRALFDRSLDCVYLHDFEGNFIDANTAALKLLGYEKKDIPSLNFASLLSEDQIPKALESLEVVRQTGYEKKLIEYKLKRKNGEYVHVETIASLMYRDGKPYAIQGIGRDVTRRKRLEEELQKQREHLEEMVKEKTAELKAANRQLQRELAERKKAEETLRQSEKRYRSILEEMGDGYYEVDLGGRFTFVNDSMCLRMGHWEEKLIGLSYRDYIAEEDTGTVFEVFNRIYMTGKPVINHHFRSRLKDGRIIFTEDSIFPVRDKNGKIIGFRGVSRDVTEREEMGEALRQSEERYRTILEEMEDNYYEVDLAGNFNFVNDSLCRTLGYSREELIGMNNRGYVAADDLKVMYQDFNKVHRTGLPIRDVRYKFIQKDGTTGIGEISVFPLRNERGEIIGFRGVGRDVTEQKHMEEALRRSEERYRTVLDEMEEGYYEQDLAGNFTFVNDSMCRLLGYSREEMIGMNYRVYTSVDDVNNRYKAWNKVYQKGEPLKWIPLGNKKKDGTTQFVEDSVLPLRNEKGEIVGFRGVSRDLTERTRMDEEKRQLEQKAYFASRLASVGGMASGIAHEISNPLTSVIGYAQLLLDEDVPDRIKKDLKAIYDGAQRVAGIMKRLLIFARQTKPERTYADINEIINNTLDLRAYNLASNNIVVTTRLEPDLPLTIADPGQLQQVFLNLIINAETEMKLAHGKGKLLVKTAQVDNKICISFKDDGPGIVKENLEKIFDPFFTTREVGEGTGLGLSVCHGIISEHKGKIYAESKLGKGATFIVEMPIVTEPEQSGLPEPEAEEREKTPKTRILVVDDEAAILEFVSQVLTNEGHEVEVVDNAEEALEMVKSKRYRIILLDIKMPGMSGIELYKHLQKITPSLARRVVFVTGDVVGARTTAFLSKTKAPRIMKPFDAKQLRTGISSILTEGM